MNNNNNGIRKVIACTDPAATRRSFYTFLYWVPLLFFFLFFFSPSPHATATNLSVAPTDNAVNLAAERDFHGNDLTGKDGPLAKVGMDLARLYREHQDFTTKRLSGAFSSGNPLARISRSAAGVDLVIIDATANGDAKALRATLETMGLQNGADYGRMVSGRLPITAIPDMAALPNLRLALPAMAKTNIGATTSQADFSMRSSVARAQSGFRANAVQARRGVSAVTRRSSCDPDSAQAAKGHHIVGAK